MIATDHFVIAPVVQELCQYLLNIFQSCLLSFESLLLGLNTPAEIIIVIIFGHVDRHKPRLFRANCGRGSIVDGFFFIV